MGFNASPSHVAAGVLCFVVCHCLFLQAVAVGIVHLAVVGLVVVMVIPASVVIVVVVPLYVALCNEVVVSCSLVWCVVMDVLVCACISSWPSGNMCGHVVVSGVAVCHLLFANGVASCVAMAFAVLHVLDGYLDVVVCVCGHALGISSAMVFVSVGWSGTDCDGCVVFDMGSVVYVVCCCGKPAESCNAVCVQCLLGNGTVRFVVCACFLCFCCVLRTAGTTGCVLPEDTPHLLVRCVLLGMVCERGCASDMAGGMVFLAWSCAMVPSVHHHVVNGATYDVHHHAF